MFDDFSCSHGSVASTSHPISGLECSRNPHTGLVKISWLRLSRVMQWLTTIPTINHPSLHTSHAQQAKVPQGPRYPKLMLFCLNTLAGPGHGYARSSRSLPWRRRNNLGCLRMVLWRNTRRMERRKSKEDPGWRRLSNILWNSAVQLPSGTPNS